MVNYFKSPQALPRIWRRPFDSEVHTNFAKTAGSQNQSPSMALTIEPQLAPHANVAALAF